jgi:hypothetical protein
MSIKECTVGGAFEGRERIVDEGHRRGYFCFAAKIQDVPQTQRAENIRIASPFHELNFHEISCASQDYSATSVYFNTPCFLEELSSYRLQTDCLAYYNNRLLSD